MSLSIYQMWYLSVVHYENQRLREQLARKAPLRTDRMRKRAALARRPRRW